MRRLVPLLAALLVTPAAAEEKADVHLLIAGATQGRVEAAIAIDLPEGWKTYWRVPGDAGIPPSIETGASKGVTAPVVRFPAPERFDEAGLTAIGYTRSVVLPVDATLLDPARPGTLDVTVMIGLCHDICVPFETRLTATIDPSRAVDPATATRIAAARARVPEAHRAGLVPAVTGARVEAGAKGPEVVVDVAMPEGAATPRDLFVEGPGPDWALPVPERRGPAGARETWVFAVDGVPTGAKIAGSALTFTIVAGTRAVEQPVTLDAGATAP